MARTVPRDEPVRTPARSRLPALFCWRSALVLRLGPVAGRPQLVSARPHRIGNRGGYVLRRRAERRPGGLPVVRPDRRPFSAPGGGDRRRPRAAAVAGLAGRA